MKKLILPFFCLILLCGCKGYKEINDGYLITGVAFAQSEKDVKITVNTILPETQESLVLSGSGKDFISAFNALKSKQTKALYFEHCGVIALDKSTKNSAEVVLSFCADKIKIPLSAQVIYCDDANSLFASDRTGYDAISLLKNVGEGADNRLYRLKQKTDIVLPHISVNDNKMVFEGRVE